MSNSLITSLTSVIYWIPALICFVVLLVATIQVIQEEGLLQKSINITIVTSVYIFCFVELLYLVVCSEVLVPQINPVRFCLLATLVLYASLPISVLIVCLLLAVVQTTKETSDAT